MQESNAEKVKIFLRNGYQYTGNILSVEEGLVRFRIYTGHIQLFPTTNIDRIEVLR